MGMLDEAVTPETLREFAEEEFNTDSDDGAEIEAYNKLIKCSDQWERAERNANKPHRKRLPDTRQSITHKFNINGHKGYVTVGLFEDGQPGELFIEIAKEGSTVGGLCDSVGILTSMALQSGVPLETLVRKFRGSTFEPAGGTTNSEQPSATSIVDYVFVWLGRMFIDGFEEEFQNLLKTQQGG